MASMGVGLIVFFFHGWWLIFSNLRRVSKSIEIKAAEIALAPQTSQMQRSPEMTTSIHHQRRCKTFWILEFWLKSTGLKVDHSQTKVHHASNFLAP